MLLTLLKSKIHRATVTECELEYEGSCSIDGELMDAVGIVQFERIEVYNINMGTRFSTYAIREEEGSGKVIINGAAARLAQPGDLVIICAFTQMDEENIRAHHPSVAHLDGENRVSNFSS